LTSQALNEVTLGIRLTEDIEQDITEADETSAGITEAISDCKHYLEITNL